MGKARLVLVTLVASLGLMSGDNPLTAGALLGGAFLLAKPSVITRTWKVVANWGDDWLHAISRPEQQDTNRTKVVRH